MNKLEKSLLFGGISLAVFIIVLLSFVGFERIDAGYDGIRVNRYGDEKGVDKVAEVTGAVWYNKIKYDIYEVPVHVLDYNYDTMGFKTKDMLDTKIGIGVQVGLPAGETPNLFIHYRRYFEKGTCNLDQLIYKHVRQGTSDAVGQYDAEDLIIHKQLFRMTVDTLVTDNLERKLLKRVTLPDDVRVLFHVPSTKAYTVDSDVHRLRIVKPLVKIAYKEALKGKFWTALTLNGLIYSLALGYDVSAALDALDAGAFAAGLCGKGPAVTAVVSSDKIDSVRAALQRHEGEILQAHLNHEKAKVV